MQSTASSVASRENHLLISRIRPILPKTPAIRAFYDHTFTKGSRVDWFERLDRMTPFVDKNLSPISCARFSSLWHDVRLPCYASHSSDIEIFAIGGLHATFFALWGQARGVRVYIFRNNEAKSPYWPPFAAILTNFFIAKKRRKPVKPCQSGKLKTFRKDLIMKLPDSSHLWQISPGIAEGSECLKDGGDDTHNTFSKTLCGLTNGW